MFISHLIVAIVFFLSQATPSFAQKLCQSRIVRNATVLNVTDAGNLIMSNRQQVKLQNILLPSVPDHLIKNDKWPALLKSVQFLRRELIGQSVLIASSNPKKDRHGKLVAQIYVWKGTKHTWLQQLLVQEGLARVSADRVSPCFTRLLAREEEARQQKKGLWALDMYQVRLASKANDLVRYEHSFQVIEGYVKNITIIRGHAYMNFGRNWRTDFTVKISKKNWKRFKTKGLAAEHYKGKRIRTRGWIELRNGPLVNISHPAQIEIID